MTGPTDSAGRDRPAPQAGYADVNGARLYYELAGDGAPLVMLHAGIADCRMWDADFAAFSRHYRALRFDMRGYGRSLPVAGDFNLQADLEALLDTLGIAAPMILMGCSIGGGLAIEYALDHPAKVASLILVGSAARGFEAEALGPDELFAQNEAAFKAGDADRVAELDMQIWFDGVGRPPEAVNAEARRQAFAMAKLVTEHELKGMGRHIRKSEAIAAADRLRELTMPALVVIGENDLPFLRLAADYLSERLPDAKKALMANAGHLPNMERPQAFQAAVRGFLAPASQARL